MLAALGAMAKPVIVELFQFCFMASFVAAMFVVFLAIMPKNEIPESIITNSNIMMMFCFITAGNFLATDWLPHFLVRQVLFWAYSFLTMITRTEDEENEGVSFALL